VLRLRSENDPLTVVEQANMLDTSYLESFPGGSFDHVLVSHVMSFLIRPSTDETRQARQRVIDELVRIARKTVVVLDRIEPGEAQMSIDIEQRDRAIVHDDLTQYFKRHETQNQVYLMLSPEDGAIVFRKATPAGAVSEG
jgi:hypothetical protein